MSTRIGLALSTLSLLAFGLTSACSSGDAGAPADGGPKKEAGGQGDAGGEDAGDGGDASVLPDSADWPKGTRIASGNVLQLEGVTSDDYAVYIDGKSETLNAVPLDGGAPEVIATVDPASIVAVSGPVVFLWTAVNPSSGAGTLQIWTPSHGAHMLSTSSQVSYPGLQAMAVSLDGSEIAFYDQLSPDGTVGALVAVGADGTGRTPLLSSLDLSTTTPCFPRFRFGGGTLVVASSTVGGSGTTVTSFTGPAWAPTTLVQKALCGFDVDRSETWLLAANTSGLAAYPLAGGTPVAIDPSGGLGFFTGTSADAGAVDGGSGDAGVVADVVYLSKSGELLRASVAPSPAPTPVLDGGPFQTIQALSGDGNVVLLNRNLDAKTYEIDLFAAPARAAGALTTLLPGTSGVFVGDLFTADSTHALYASQTDPNVATLNLYAAPVSGSSSATLLATGVVVSDFATAGGKVVFLGSDPASLFVYRISLIDTSTSSPPVAIVTMADSPFFLSAARDKVVYTWTQGYGPIAGLYVQVLP